MNKKEEKFEIEVLVDGGVYWRIVFRTSLDTGIKVCAIQHKCSSADKWSLNWIWGEKVQYCKKCFRAVAEEVQEKWLVLSLTDPGSNHVVFLP